MRNFALQQRNLRPGNIGSIGIDVGSRPVRIGSGTNSNRVLPGFFNLNDRHARIDAVNHAHAFGVKAKFLHLLQGQFAEGIVADSTDEADITAHLGDRNRLIGTLATEADTIARCIHGLPRTRQCGHPRADIHIHTAENENLQHRLHKYRRISCSSCIGNTRNKVEPT